MLDGKKIRDSVLLRCRIPQELQLTEALYAEAFPPAEQRALADRERQLQLGIAHYYRLERQGAPIGLLHLWHLSNCLFIEHLALAPSERNRGLGGEILRTLLQQSTAPCLLEVEPHDGAMASRRIGFYERLGFSILLDDYLQPSYAGPEGEPLPLYLMGCGGTALQTKARDFANSIHRQVYGVTLSAR